VKETMTTHAEIVARRLTQVYETKSPQQTRELSDLRLILFSDLHKGQRDGADDFDACEPTYLAALDYYWEQGFELFLIGDIEELWENSPQPVVRAYADVLNREKVFAEARQPSRYARFVGNHDDMWYDTQKAQAQLGPYLAGAAILEGLRLAVNDQGQRLGELFFVHGHQGSLDSDRLARLSAWLVRHVWRPIQRITRIPVSTPSNNFTLRQKQELAMYDYAARRPGMVLIAGHTHHPVWEGMGLQQAMAQLRDQGIGPLADSAWLQDQVKGAVTLPAMKPCYFNTGCCSYRFGSISGIEIADGEIRLVTWQDPESPRRVEVFPPAQLRDVLARLA
jgi:UDP-2,3-diacylglucosamine pyrophosphatase LpxH